MGQGFGKSEEEDKRGEGMRTRREACRGKRGEKEREKKGV